MNVERARLDKILARIRGAMMGYSGFFDLVDVNETALDRVYAHDVALMERTASLAEQIEGLRGQAGDAQTLLAPTLELAEQIDDEWDRREDILKGLE